MHRWAFAIPAVFGVLSQVLPSQTLAETCEASLRDSIHAVELAVDSISIETAGPVAAKWNIDNLGWMHGELALIREACSRGRDVEAVWRLERVQYRMRNIPQGAKRKSGPASDRVLALTSP